MNESNNNEEDAINTPRAQIVVSDVPEFDSERAAEIALDILSQVTHEDLPLTQDLEAIAEGIGDAAVAKSYGADVHKELLDDWAAGDTLLAKQFINDSLQQAIHYIDGYLALTKTSKGKEPAFSLEEYSSYEANGDIRAWQTIETVVPDTEDTAPVDVRITSLFLPSGIEITLHDTHDSKSMMTIRLPRANKPPLIYQAGDPLLEQLYTSDETSESSVQPDYMDSHEDTVFAGQIAESDTLDALTQKMKIVSDLYIPDATPAISDVNDEVKQASQLAEHSIKLADIATANIPNLQSTVVAMQRYLHSTQVANKHTVDALLSNGDVTVQEIQSLFIKTYLAEHVTIPKNGFLPMLFNRSFKKMFESTYEQRAAYGQQTDFGGIGTFQFYSGCPEKQQHRLQGKSLWSQTQDASEVLKKINIGEIVDTMLEICSMVDGASFSESSVSLSTRRVPLSESYVHHGYVLDSLLKISDDLIIEYLGSNDYDHRRYNMALRFLIDGHFEIIFNIDPSTGTVKNIYMKILDVNYNIFTKKENTYEASWHRRAAYGWSLEGKDLDLEPICKELRVSELIAMFEKHQSTTKGQEQPTRHQLSSV